MFRCQDRRMWCVIDAAHRSSLQHAVAMALSALSRARRPVTRASAGTRRTIATTARFDPIAAAKRDRELRTSPPAIKRSPIPRLRGRKSSQASRRARSAPTRRGSSSSAKKSVQGGASTKAKAKAQATNGEANAKAKAKARAAPTTAAARASRAARRAEQPKPGPKKPAAEPRTSGSKATAESPLSVLRRRANAVRVASSGARAGAGVLSMFGDEPSEPAPMPRSPLMTQGATRAVRRVVQPPAAGTAGSPRKRPRQSDSANGSARASPGTARNVRRRRGSSGERLAAASAGTMKEGSQESAGVDSSPPRDAAAAAASVSSGLVGGNNGARSVGCADDVGSGDEIDGAGDPTPTTGSAAQFAEQWIGRKEQIIQLADMFGLVRGSVCTLAQ